MEINNTWQCSCHCWDRTEHGHYVSYLANRALQKEPKWSATATDLSTGSVVEHHGNLHSDEAWHRFDCMRQKYGACKRECAELHHECVDVVIAFNGVGEKSSIWS